MSDDNAFLRAIIASPQDDAIRLVYADWLEERNDPRAELLRTDWHVPRLSFVDWIAQQDNLKYYLILYPDLQPFVLEHQANAVWREKRKAIEQTASLGWLSLLDTLGRPFQPFFFWNNTGPRSFQNGELPFREPIGTRGPIVTFESAFRGEEAWQPGLEQDLSFLCQLDLGNCSSGAASCPVHPFICELDDTNSRLTGATIVRALKARDFRSQHIPSLDASRIAYPGYQPGTDNDEVHNDPGGQYIFSPMENLPSEGAHFRDEVDLIAELHEHNRLNQTSEDSFWQDDEMVASLYAHKILREEVKDQDLWYVLLHNRNISPRDDSEEYTRDRGEMVVLFAVGRSPRGNRLIGVVTHQMCHNFCD